MYICLVIAGRFETNQMSVSLDLSVDPLIISVRVVLLFTENLWVWVGS